MKHSYQLTAKITLAVKNYLCLAYEVQELCNFASLTQNLVYMTSNNSR